MAVHPEQDKPDVWTDEEGEYAYCSVTAVTMTADAARDYIVAHAVDELYYEADEALDPAKIPMRGLTVKLKDTGVLPTQVDVAAHVAAGGSAWWSFDISCARIVDREETDRV